MASVTIIPQGAIGAITIDATFEETLNDELQLTQHPVEAGAQISDHSFKLPKTAIMRCGWSNACAAAQNGVNVATMINSSIIVADYVSAVYSKLVALQETREPFTLMTTIRQYANMLLTGIALTRDQRTSQALMVTATLKEVILVSTSSTTLPPLANQANPQNTAGQQNAGNVQLTPATPAPGGSAPASIVFGPGQNIVPYN
jgi:hypothetical protein